MRLRISSIRNRFDGSETATVSMPRTTNSGSTRFFSMYSRGSTSTIFGIEQPGFELGVGHAVLGGQALDDLVLGAEFQLDEDLAQQLAAAALLLLGQRSLQLLGEVASLDEQVAEASCCDAVHGRVRGVGGRRSRLRSLSQMRQSARSSATESSSRRRSRCRTLRVAGRAG